MVTPCQGVGHVVCRTPVWIFVDLTSYQSDVVVVMLSNNSPQDVVA